MSPNTQFGYQQVCLLQRDLCRHIMVLLKQRSLSLTSLYVQPIHNNALTTQFQGKSNKTY